LAEEEKRSDSQLAERLKELGATADHLIQTAKKTRMDNAVAHWVAKMHSIAKEAAESAMDVLEEKRSTNYAIDMVDDDIQMFEEQGQKVAGILILQR
jgi:hypothetical protein